MIYFVKKWTFFYLTNNNNCVLTKYDWVDNSNLDNLLIFFHNRTKFYNKQKYFDAMQNLLQYSSFKIHPQLWAVCRVNNSGSNKEMASYRPLLCTLSKYPGCITLCMLKYAKRSKLQKFMTICNKNMLCLHTKVPFFEKVFM